MSLELQFCCCVAFVVALLVGSFLCLGWVTFCGVALYVASCTAGARCVRLKVSIAARDMPQILFAEALRKAAKVREARRP